MFTIFREKKEKRRRFEEHSMANARKGGRGVTQARRKRSNMFRAVDMFAAVPTVEQRVGVWDLILVAAVQRERCGVRGRGQQRQRGD